MNVKAWSSIFWITLVASVWLGFMISITGGVLYPPIDKIARPFLCANGEMQVDERTYYPSPVTTVTTLDWYCVNTAAGTQEAIPTLKLALFEIPIYSLIVFFPILAIVAYWKFIIAPRNLTKRREVNMEAGAGPFQRMLDFGQRAESSFASSSAGSEVEELKKLKEMLDSGLITQQDYDQKKAEILKRL